MSETQLFSEDSDPQHEKLLISDMTVIMPIGGRGARALEVTNDEFPKHLIKLGNGRTVLDTICIGLQKAGFRNFVFCLGHHKIRLASHLSEESWKVETNATYKFSVEDRPLGPDGAILLAIKTFGLRGQALLVPGDLLFPWSKARDIALRHAAFESDVTIGVTSSFTERTTDIGNIVGEDETDRLLWCKGRLDQAVKPLWLNARRNLANAGISSISIARFVELFEVFRIAKEIQQITGKVPSLQDEILPWLVDYPGFKVHIYDIGSEILDLGTPSNIEYGKENWEKFV